MLSTKFTLFFGKGKGSHLMEASFHLFGLCSCLPLLVQSAEPTGVEKFAAGSIKDFIPEVAVTERIGKIGE